MVFIDPFTLLNPSSTTCGSGTETKVCTTTVTKDVMVLPALTDFEKGLIATLLLIYILQEI